MEVLWPLRQELRLYPGARETDGSPSWTLQDPVRNRFFNIGWAEFEILKRWSSRDVKAIVDDVNKETTLDIDENYIDQLNEFLSSNELLQIEGEDAVSRFAERKLKHRSEWKKRLLHNYLFFRQPLVHPDRFLNRLFSYVKPLITIWVLLVVMVLGISGLYLVSRQWDVFLKTIQYSFSLEGMLYYGIALLGIKVLHELGHALACKYYGLRVPSMGVAFLVMWPVLYTDTTEAWKLTSRRQRMVIGSAGMAVELMVALLATFMWSFLPDGPVRSAMFFLATTSWVLTLLININPFLRWDGYYLLSDYLGVRNLQQQGFALAQWQLREWLFNPGLPQPRPWSSGMKKILLSYAYATWLYRFILFLSIALLVYYFFFKLAGIILMLVELYWFIVKPILKELSHWWEIRQQWSYRRGVGLGILFITVLFLLVLPIDWRVEAPAIIKSQRQQNIYLGTSGKLVTLYKKNGDHVSKGELIFRFESPELNYEINKTEFNIRKMTLHLARISNENNLNASRLTLMQQLAEEKATLNKLRDQKKKLVVVAEFDGEIRDISLELVKGRWVSDNQLLARLVDEQSSHVIAYVHEDDIERIAHNDSAKFYATNDISIDYDLVVSRIDQFVEQHIEDYYFSSEFGGPLAMSRDKEGKIVPDKALYRIELLPQSNTVDGGTIAAGEVRIKAEAVSIATGIWKAASAVLIREASF